MDADPTRTQLSPAVPGFSRLLLLCVIVPSVGCNTHSSDGRFPSEAETLLSAFSTDKPSAQAYEELFHYFLQGFVTYRDSFGASAAYPGLPSDHGRAIDAMEGFTRFAPLAASWLRSGRPALAVVNGTTVDLIGLIRRGLIAGTDPESPAYWGQITDYDQRWVEASDVALVLWLTKDLIWNRLHPSEKQRVSQWLSGGVTARIADNNWHLFSAFVPLVLRDLGIEADTLAALEHYNRFKTFYRGDGWFSDGPDGVYDFYNAWGIHYQLYWIDRVRPAWDPEFIASSREAFLASYKFLFARDGIPIVGRSVCYRMAAPAPLLLDYVSSRRSTKPGEARRALDLTWTFFIAKGAVRRGTVSQGYCGPDERVLDNYSGPASCLWSLRSLVAAFMIPREDPFWREPAGLLPIDLSNFQLRVNAIGWMVTGDAQAGTTTIVINDSLSDDATELSSSGPWSDLKSLLSQRPHRPRNHNAKYLRGTYSSAEPFCECFTDSSAGLTSLR